MARSTSKHGVHHVATHRTTVKHGHKSGYHLKHPRQKGLKHPHKGSHAPRAKRKKKA